MHFNWQNFSGISELCPSHHSILDKNAKITFFGNKKGFECSLYRIEVQVVKNWSSRLGKHRTFVFSLRVDVLCIFENITFFEIFEKLLGAHARMVECILVLLNMVGLTL